jgi:hypothetical protein
MYRFILGVGITLLILVLVSACSPQGISEPIEQIEEETIVISPTEKKVEQKSTKLNFVLGSHVFANTIYPSSFYSNPTQLCVSPSGGVESYPFYYLDVIKAGDNPATNLKVSFEILGFTERKDYAFEIVEGKLKVEWEPHPKKSLLTVKENTPAKVVIQMSYLDNFGKLIEEKMEEDLTIGPRGLFFECDSLSTLLGKKVGEPEIKSVPGLKLIYYMTPADEVITKEVNKGIHLQNPKKTNMEIIWKNVGDLAPTYEFEDTVGVEHYPIETIRSGSGDCSDTTILFSSAFEVVRIPTKVVGIRAKDGGNINHVLLLFNANDKWEALETTWVGKESLEFAIERGEQIYDEGVRENRIMYELNPTDTISKYGLIPQNNVLE